MEVLGLTGEETIGKKCIHCGIMSEHGTVAEDHGHYTLHHSYGKVTHDNGEVYYFGGYKKCTNKYGHQFQ